MLSRHFPTVHLHLSYSFHCLILLLATLLVMNHNTCPYLLLFLGSSLDPINNTLYLYWDRPGATVSNASTTRHNFIGLFPSDFGIYGRVG